MNTHRDLIERLKREVSILRLLPNPVAHTGDVIMIRCPFPGHEDKNPSCAIYVATNSWYCFSHPSGPCGGSVIDFVMRLHGLDFWGAVRFLADFMGWTLDPPTEVERVAAESRHKQEEVLGVLVRYAHSQLLRDADTAKQAREYLAGRGFDLELLDKHRVGLLSLETLYKFRAQHPLLADFSQADFEETGLRTEKGFKLFRGTRIAFPLIEGQRVVGMTFRAMPGSSDKPKYIQLAGQPAGLWNADALWNPERRVFFTEGVLDALTLTKMGFPSVGNMGLQVAKNAHRFSHLKEVIIVFDNDDAGRGSAPKTAGALQNAMKDGVVKVLTLPSENDINDWAQAGGTVDEFKALWKAAPDLLDVLIGQLPKEADLLQEGDLEPVLEIIRTRSSLGHKALLKRVASHVPVPVGELSSRLAASKPSATPTGAKPAPSTPGTESKGESPKSPGQKVPLIQQVLQPGLSLGYNGDLPTWRMGVHIQRSEPFSATDGTLVHVTTKELIVVQDLPDGLKVTTEPFSRYAQSEEEQKRFPGRRFPAWDQDPVHGYNMFSILDNECPSVSGYQLFDDVKGLLTRFLWFPDPRDLDLVATWVLLTYVFPAFNSVPYLHFHGGKASGKTTALNFVSRLAFNAMKCAGPTEAAASMHVANTSGTLVIDESEHLLNPRPGSREEFLLQILLIGYQAGAILSKGDAESQQAVERCVFGPKCLGSIGRIQHVLRSRCLTIHTKEAGPDHIPEGDLNHDAREVAIACRSLLNRLHVWSLRNGLALHERVTHNMRDIDRRDLGNRDRELWLPLLTIARHLDVERGVGAVLETTLMALRRVKEQEYKAIEAEENPKSLYLQVLANLLEEKGHGLMVINQAGRRQDWYPAAELLNNVEHVIHEQRMLPPHVNHEVGWLRGVLFEYGVIESKTRVQQRVFRPDGPSKNVECFLIPREPLQAALRKLCVLQDAEEEAKPTAHLEALHPPTGRPNTQTKSPPTGTDDLPF